MPDIEQFIDHFSTHFSSQSNLWPWEITGNIEHIINECILHLNENYTVNGNIAIHKTAVVEANVIIKDSVIIGENCFIGANAYLRGGVFLGSNSRIGPGCEIKSSIIFNNSTVAHFNFIGDSIVGSNVNFEAGAVIANHYNEKQNKVIAVKYGSNVISTGTNKFGALVGDHSKIGANAVLSPGTILPKKSIVRRLELVEQHHPQDPGDA